MFERITSRRQVLVWAVVLGAALMAGGTAFAKGGGHGGGHAGHGSHKGSMKGGHKVAKKGGKKGGKKVGKKGKGHHKHHHRHQRHHRFHHRHWSDSWGQNLYWEGDEQAWYYWSNRDDCYYSVNDYPLGTDEDDGSEGYDDE